MRLLSGPNNSLINELQAAACRHSGGRLRMAVAWAREEGVRWILDALNGRITQVEVVVGINAKGTTVEALLQLLPQVSNLSIFYKHPSQTFHPKVYIFEGGNVNPNLVTVIVGSSNLTHGGLIV